MAVSKFQFNYFHFSITDGVLVIPTSNAGKSDHKSNAIYCTFASPYLFIGSHFLLSITIAEKREHFN